MKIIQCVFDLLILALQVLSLKQPICKIQGKFELNGLYKNGDIVLGGIFEAHFAVTYPELHFGSKPDQLKCKSFSVLAFQEAQTMIFAIEEINRNPALLPNITLGYRLYDNCENLGVALRAATALISGEDDSVTDYSCTGTPPVLAIVGDPGSTNSIAVSRLLGHFQVPMVSYFATCSCLSNRKEFPSFFRTIPSDAFQVKAMVQIIRHYGWTWVGAIASSDDYGQSAIKSFIEEVNKFGCIAFSETLHSVLSKARVLQILQIIKQSTARVIVVFSQGAYFIPLALEIARHNITDRQWIASEAWTTSTVILREENFHSFGGTIGIAIRRGEIPGLKEFLLQAHPVSDPKNNFINLFWETLFDCKLQDIQKYNSSSEDGNKICTGYEDINSIETLYSDVSELRTAYTVYKAVYALAHSLHNLMSCEPGKGPFQNNSCADITTVQPWQLLQYLARVNFTTHYGDRVSFDENGDALAIYDLMNWQRADDGSVKRVTIGLYDESAPAGQELSLNEDKIFWNFESKTPPRSVCSESCQPGTWKATRKGEPLCCFDCVPCAEGEISNHTDSVECFKCPADYWSNSKRDQCVPKEIEFLSYEETLGISLTTISVLGACISAAVLAVFIYYRNTPVVRANNSELSFLLLLSLILCFLCSLLFIGQPLHLTCMLRHVVFGISFVLCISCILVKTIVVIMAFRATLPDNNVMKWFGAAQQRGTVFVFTVIQAMICIIWLSTASPVPFKNTQYQNSKIIFECNVGSITGFSFLLGYIGLLASVCFLLAFLARNLPDNFNEAKFITFSMLIFCAVWIAFIPAYVSSPGKYSDAVEIFAILASSFGLLIAIFVPKCYIILLHPEKNTKKVLMGRAGPKK
ncbi:extracellular calcium-sensing receptor-like [Lepisosteus oculatus]|uniref:extracellular calcium-sensing receptor-like n=1 Tax=Lepisosteus oculatus TaxID=7918 RepID=UPI0035F52B65